MLDKAHRLKKDTDYKRLLKNSRSCSFGALSARADYNNLDVTRIGVVTGTALSKKAVVRNRVRRQLQEIVRLLIKEDKIIKGIDLFIRPFPKAIGLSYQELNVMVVGLFQKMGVLV